MSAVPETPKDGARRILGKYLRDGFVADGLHPYRDASGTVLFYRARCKHPDGRKEVRPMRLDGLRYVPSEPLAPDAGKSLYRLPELLAADPALPALVVEGEKCADAAAKRGMIATTSGGASSAMAADWTPLQGRSVLVWPDHDAPGQTYAREVCDALRALGCAVEVIDVAGLGLPEHGDIADWLAANPNATAADILALPRCDSCDIATLPAAPSPPRHHGTGQTAPEPLRRPTPPPEPYPLEALGEVLQPAAQAIARVIQAPEAIIGGSLLAASSLASQHAADVHLDGRVYPLALWLLNVAESGERKSAVDTEAMQAARTFEVELRAAFDDETERYNADKAQWDARVEAAKAAAKKKKGEGLADALRAIGPAPDAPLLPRVTVADFTAEGLYKMLAASRPSVGAFTDEAALVFGGHGMSKETVMRTAATMCKLWDRGELDRNRASEGATKLYGRRFALHLLAQPVIAERALSDDVLRGQGFLARCLLAWPEGTAGTRPYCAETLRGNPALIRFKERLLHLHRQPLPLAKDRRQELEPRELRLSPEAFETWRTLHDTVETHCGKDGRFAQVKPWASKTPEQALRIAGVLALVEQPDAHTITDAVMDRAAELALWHLNEAVRLAGVAELAPEVRDAEALLEWCHATGRRHLHSRDALRLGPARIRDRERFAEAMDELTRAGWAIPMDGGMELDGAHRRHVWRIVPASEER